MTIDEYKEFSNLPICDQLKYGNYANWKAGVEVWELVPTLLIVETSTSAIKTVIKVGD